MRLLLRPTAVLALTVGLAGCSGHEGHEKSSSGAGAAGNGTDLAFVREMIPHHESAVAMAELGPKEARSAFVKELARDIVAAQRREISVMRAERGQLEKAKVEPASLGLSEDETGTHHSAAGLKGERPFDRAFIDQMIPHHQGAIRMARVELAKGRNRRLKALARSILASQSREIEAMNRHRREVYGASSPAGGVPSANGGGGGGAGHSGGGHSEQGH